MGEPSPGPGRFLRRLETAEERVERYKEKYLALQKRCSSLEAWKDFVEKWMFDMFAVKFEPKDDNTNDDVFGTELGNTCQDDTESQYSSVVVENDDSDRQSSFSTATRDIDLLGSESTVLQTSTASQVNFKKLVGNFVPNVVIMKTEPMEMDLIVKGVRSLRDEDAETSTTVHEAGTKNKTASYTRSPTTTASNLNETSIIPPRAASTSSKQSTISDKSRSKRERESTGRCSDSERSTVQVGSSSINENSRLMINETNLSTPVKNESPAKSRNLSPVSIPRRNATSPMPNVEQSMTTILNNSKSVNEVEQTFAKPNSKRASLKNSQEASSSKKMIHNGNSGQNESYVVNGAKINGKSLVDTDEEVLSILFDTDSSKMVTSTPNPKPTSFGRLTRVTNGGIDADDIPCAVCNAVDPEPKNEMVFCDICNVCVHQACYGIRPVPKGKWLCSPCTLGKDTKNLPCYFCPAKGGALKPVNSPARRHWGHVCCALWIPEIKLNDELKMEPIVNVQKIPESRWKLKCSLCPNRTGACIQCQFSKKCVKAFHVTCAIKNKLEMQYIDNEALVGGCALIAHCKAHTNNELEEKKKGKKSPKKRNKNRAPKRAQTLSPVKDNQVKRKKLSIDDFTMPQ